MAIALTSQRKSFNIVISDLSLCKNIKVLKDTLDILSQYGFTYYACKHDKDVDAQGVLKRAHLHVVLVSLKLLRVKQVLNILCDLFGCFDVNIQVIECISVVGAVQYLTHKNNADKYKYSINDIYTNDTYDNFMRIYSEELHKDTITTDYLISVVCDPNYNRIDIIRALGIGIYNAYRGTINDLRCFIGGNINDEHDNFIRNHTEK